MVIFELMLLSSCHGIPFRVQAAQTHRPRQDMQDHLTKASTLMNPNDRRRMYYKKRSTYFLCSQAWDCRTFANNLSSIFCGIARIKNKTSQLGNQKETQGMCDVVTRFSGLERLSKRWAQNASLSSVCEVSRMGSEIWWTWAREHRTLMFLHWWQLVPLCLFGCIIGVIFAKTVGTRTKMNVYLCRTWASRRSRCNIELHLVFLWHCGIKSKIRTDWCHVRQFKTYIIRGLRLVVHSKHTNVSLNKRARHMVHMYTYECWSKK